MRAPLSALFYCCAAAGAASAATDVWVYTYDIHSSTPSKPQARLSSQEANLILSKRIGHANDLSLGDAEEELISRIDQYGGYQRTLFDTKIVTKLLVEIEDFRDNIKSLSHQPHLRVPKLESLQRQTDKISDEKCIQDVDFGPSVTANVIYNDVSAKDCTKKDRISVEEWLQITSISTSAETKIDLSKAHQSFESGFLHDIHDTLSDAAQNSGIQSTLIIYPHGSRPPTSKPTTHINRRRTPEEEPLSNAIENNTNTLPLTILQNSTSPPTQKPLNTTRLCYTNSTNCALATNNCSSHGSCALLRKDTSASPPTECWSCSCTRTTVRVNDDGTKKTVQWGGNACQKKDVSMEFWLFAGFAVAMAAAVSWGVGLLFSMGEEPLPSVLGAGVAGPRAQR
ncbi:MAG: hypothetical protein Q9160_002006 [Pyrenula sp. 1 TL-2023]